MSNGAAGAAAGAAAAQHVIGNAIKASGAIVQVEARAFTSVLESMAEPVVVCAKGGFFSSKYRYLTSYKGFVFQTTTRNPLRLPGDAETLQARKIWIPG